MEYVISNKLSQMKPSAIREIFKSLTDPSVISFAAGNPSPLSFPVKELAKISADIYENDAVTALQYSISEGYPPLIKDVNERLKNKFNICDERDETIITSGGQQGIELACKTLCNEGDIVVCEDPTFIGALNSFRSCGAVPVGIPSGENGIDAEALDKLFTETKNVRMLYLIPTFQNPGGFTMPLEARCAVYEVCKKHGVIILEDNPYGELRFKGENIPTFKSMDTENLVLYSSSFSKILSSGMRLGYITGPKPVIQKMVVAKQAEDVHSNIYFQMLTHRYINECDLDGHIAEINRLYLSKCGLMLKALDENMPEGITYTRPEGGLFLWMTLPEKIDMTDFVKKALEAKVAVVPGTTFLCNPNDKINAVRLNYSTPSDEQIVEGCKILGRVAKEMLRAN